MESIGRRNDHRFNFRVGKHGIIVKIFSLGLIDGGHAIHQISGNITDGIEIGIAGLLAGFKMGKLCNGSATKHPYFQPALLFFGHLIASKPNLFIA